MRRLIAAFARNLVFANILLAAIVIAGAIGTVLMNREMFPETSIDMILINVPFPGGGLMRTPILKLAMSWYAMRDRLGV